MKRRINIYTDLALEAMSDDQITNMVNLARRQLQKTVMEENLEARWNTAEAKVEKAAIGPGQTRCWIEVEVR